MQPRVYRYNDIGQAASLLIRICDIDTIVLSDDKSEYQIQTKDGYLYRLRSSAIIQFTQDHMFIR